MKYEQVMQKTFAIFLSFAMVLFINVPCAWAAGEDSPTSKQAISDCFSAGSGSAGDPYIITSAAQLSAFRDSVNAGTDYAGLYIKLGNDLDITGQDWTPIGVSTRKGAGIADGSTPFKGIFNGGGHVITGLSISKTQNADQTIGLFGAVVGGTVEDLIIKNANIDVPASELAGIAVGMLTNGGVVSKIHTSGTIKAFCGTGGVIGRMTNIGSVTDCINDATVSTTAGSGNTGGIVGAAYYTTPDGKMIIDGCTNTGQITGKNDVGGIAGLCCAFVSACVNTGSISGNDYALGGIAGEMKNYGAIEGCTNSGNISYTGNASDDYGMGGITGWVRYDGNPPAYAASSLISVINNNNAGSVVGQNDAGGIIGTVYSSATVMGNQNTASSLTSDRFAGGIVGNVQRQNTNIPASVIPEILIQDNVSTTPTTAIHANLKNAYVYNNIGDAAIVRDNGTSWAASDNGSRYVSLQNAFDRASTGDIVKLQSDLSDTPQLKISNPGQLTLDLNNHNIAFNPDGGFVVTNGSFAITGSGNVSKPQGTQNPELITIQPAAGASPEVHITGGTYSADVASFIPQDYTESIRPHGNSGAEYIVVPASGTTDGSGSQSGQTGGQASSDQTAGTDRPDQSSGQSDGNQENGGSSAATDGMVPAAHMRSIDDLYGSVDMSKVKVPVSIPKGNGSNYSSLAGSTAGSTLQQTGDTMSGYILAAGIAVIFAGAVAILALRRLERK